MVLLQRMSKYRVNEYHAFLSFPLARVNFQNARDKHFYASDIGASTVSLFSTTSHRVVLCSYLPLFRHFLPPLPKFPSPRK